MNAKLITIIFLISLINLNAQNQANIWYFGNGAGLDFNNGEPQPLNDGKIIITTNTQENEGSSVISDNEGNLLFYADGETVWDKNHQIMPNGDGLLGHNSSTHPAFIVPLPLSNQYFYLFTTDSWFHTNLENGLRFSVIDMCLNDGLGDVIINKKNILLEDLMTEKIAVVRHNNGIDYWVVAHKYKSQDFLAYHLTPDGLDFDNVVTSNIGAIHQISCCPNDLGAAIGQMKISPNGKKLALCFTNASPNVFELFDFNTTTGVVTNTISFTNFLADIGFTAYGIEFSPDNSKLYLCTTDGIFQVNLNAGNNESIVNSFTQIAFDLNNRITYGMQLAPNNKIYIANERENFLSIIENPNELGEACNFIEVAQLLNGRIGSYSFPSFIAGFDYSNTKSEVCDCAGIMAGKNILDECGECLLLEDPNFNQSCADCEGLPNGNNVLDDCGECLPIANPNFNQSCADCKGTPNGNNVIDECGECLPLDDLNFNQSCADCKGEPNGNNVIDDCGECLPLDDPEFNQRCADCKGILNGYNVIDYCGECLLPDDPNFNQGCADCKGELNGNNVIDECGECLPLNDPNFNRSCADCSGQANGNKVIDDCGECLPPNDPNFNQSCVDCSGQANGNNLIDDCGECLPLDDPLFNLSCLEAKIFIPNAFSPNEDGVNDLFKVYNNNTLPVLIKNYVIYNRLGQKLHSVQNFDVKDSSFWWDGMFKNRKQALGVYIYFIEVEILNKPAQQFKGNVTLVR